MVEMASIDEAYLDLLEPAVSTDPRLLPLTPFDRDRRDHRTALLRRSRCARDLLRKWHRIKPNRADWCRVRLAPRAGFSLRLACAGFRNRPCYGSGLAYSGNRNRWPAALVPQERLEEFFGRWGTALWRKARGEDSYDFLIDAEPKSISHSHTFGSDTRDRTALESMLSRLCQLGAKRLRDAGLDTRTVTLTLDLRGFITVTRSRLFA